VAGTAAALAAAIYVPAVSHVFRFAALAAPDLAVSAAAGLVSVLWYDLYKVMRRSRNPAASVPADANP